MDLSALLQKHEGKELEFKRDLSSTDGILRTIVAFSNTAGGTLIIGIEDRTKTVRGVAEPLDAEERLANLISDSIVPKVLPDLEIIPFRDTQIVAVRIYPSATRPHHLKREGELNGTYVRVGSTNRKADAELIGEMQRFARGEIFDERPMPELTPNDLDVDAAVASFERVRRIDRKDLSTIGVLSRYHGKQVPSVGGVILFGKNRLDPFPDAWIQAGRFSGVNKASIVDRIDLKMYPTDSITKVINFIESQSSRAVSIGKVYRTDIWPLPPSAVREAVINAVAHADYSQRSGPIRVSMFDDRLEIENPGLLPFGLTIDDLRLGVSKLRNRVIGRVFNELGLVEQWGSGIQRIIASCEEAGLLPPQLEEIGNRFRITLWFKRISEPDLDKVDRRIVDFVAVPGGRGTQAIARHIGLTTRATRTRLNSLIDRGFVGQISTGPRDPKKKYFKMDGERSA